jgi:hypothetical protein
MHVQSALVTAAFNLLAKLSNGEDLPVINCTMLIWFDIAAYSYFGSGINYR